MSWQTRIAHKKDYHVKAIGQPIDRYAFEPGPFPEKRTGNVTVEGPFPVHKWYARVTVDTNGNVTKVE